MLERDDQCSLSRPATLGGLSWICVPSTARVGDSAPYQMSVVRMAADVRKSELESLPRGSRARHLASNRERSMRVQEWYDRREITGYEHCDCSYYSTKAHYELVWPD